MHPGHCGMDFGTSNSTLGIHHTHSPELIPLEADRPVIPSALFFDFEDDTVHFGRRAIEHYVEGVEGRLLQSLKSVLGSRLMGDKTQLKTRALSFEEILGHYIAHLKQRAENHLGRELSSIVVGRPVRFDDDSDSADAKAQETLARIVRSQGFTEVEFQYEPIAAAFDFEQQIQREQLALIIDIGGGTSDFSLVRLSPERRQRAERQQDVLASHGVHIGGTDFDRLLSLSRLMPQMGLGSEMRNSTGSGKLQVPAAIYHYLATWHTINLQYSRSNLEAVQSWLTLADQRPAIERLYTVLKQRLGHQLAIEVERAKIALTQDSQYRIDLQLIEPDWHCALSASDLDEAIGAAVAQVVQASLKTLQQAGVNPRQIDALFLTGGSTAIDSLAEDICALFPEAQVVTGNRFGSVGLGLALDAARRFA